MGGFAYLCTLLILMNMVLLMDKKDDSMTGYRSLRDCVAANRGFSYSYLRRVKLGYRGFNYKGYLIFRVNHRVLRF